MLAGYWLQAGNCLDNLEGPPGPFPIMSPDVFMGCVILKNPQEKPGSRKETRRATRHATHCVSANNMSFFNQIS
jgi:hypothetical protein